MKTYDIHDKHGQLAAFEISNTFIGRRGFCRVVEKIPGATVKRRPKPLSWWREDTFCVFEVEGIEFEAEEPFGDNSRYWAGQTGLGENGKELSWCPQIEVVKNAFINR